MPTSPMASECGVERPCAARASFAIRSVTKYTIASTTSPTMVLCTRSPNEAGGPMCDAICGTTEYAFELPSRVTYSGSMNVTGRKSTRTGVLSTSRTVEPQKIAESTTITSASRSCPVTPSSSSSALHPRAIISVICAVPVKGSISAAVAIHWFLHPPQHMHRCALHTGTPPAHHPSSVVGLAYLCVVQCEARAQSSPRPPPRRT